MCTSVNNQTMSIMWKWAGYGAFLFRHWHNQPFNGRLLDNSFLSVGLQFEDPTYPFHMLQSGSGSRLLPECLTDPSQCSETDEIHTASGVEVSKLEIKKTWNMLRFKQRQLPAQNLYKCTKHALCCYGPVPDITKYPQLLTEAFTISLLAIVASLML